MPSCGLCRAACWCFSSHSASWHGRGCAVVMTVGAAHSLSLGQHALPLTFFALAPKGPQETDGEGCPGLPLQTSRRGKSASARAGLGGKEAPGTSMRRRGWPEQQELAGVGWNPGPGNVTCDGEGAEQLLCGIQSFREKGQPGMFHTGQPVMPRCLPAFLTGHGPLGSMGVPEKE